MCWGSLWFLLFSFYNKCLESPKEVAILKRSCDFVFVGFKKIGMKYGMQYEIQDGNQDWMQDGNQDEMKTEIKMDDIGR